MSAAITIIRLLGVLALLLLPKGLMFHTWMLVYQSYAQRSRIFLHSHDFFSPETEDNPST